MIASQVFAYGEIQTISYYDNTPTIFDGERTNNASSTNQLESSFISSVESNPEYDSLNSRDLQSFDIFRDGVLIDNITSDTYTYRDNSLMNMNEYCYTLRSNYDEGQSEMSDPVCATPYPGPPAYDLVADDLGGTIGLNWLAAPIESIFENEGDILIDYQIYKDGVNIGNVGPNITSFIDDGEIIEIDPGLFTDQSNLFTDYYIFAGIFLLAPAVLVIFWNRNRWRDGINQIEIEQHELRRLRRLRERLTALLAEEETNEQVIDSALHQLGDSPWQAVVEDWGEPLLRHNTEQVEICAWRINEGIHTMLIGIRIAESPVELAAMRVYAPEGASVSIAEVSPKHLFNGDEIFLDTLSPLTSTFLRLSISGEPSNIGFHLSGLVNGEPLAAVPNRAIDWS